ncbi:hypothetical protein RFI_12571 [Reticulomyxa filosa]|uniref:Uncharacterized protein n=1 Tax=Reticulomyxa filosa TaxID=46433 RepID=X6NF10_RETFI|nr:hypothetical protein RFI_12571 [Reticulomyxa filosa]|eukprot:ETO24586.1 hypothetical protein RFI_12571 [Reticulomyxa filosa]
MFKKSGGTSVCGTMLSLGLTPLAEVSSGGTCNFAGGMGGVVYRFVDVGATTCQQQHALADVSTGLRWRQKTNRGSISVVAKSNVFGGSNNTSNLAMRYPRLCDYFQYIVPFREPLEKVVSFVGQSNLGSFAPAFYLKRRDTTIPNWQELYCDGFNGKDYVFSQWQDAKDMDGFLSELFINENQHHRKFIDIDFEPTNKSQNESSMWRCEPWFRRSAQAMWQDSRQYRIWYLGETLEKSQFAIACGFSDLSHRNIYTIKAQFNNIYTRTLGFEHKHKWYTYDALFAASNEITMQHFQHALMTYLQCHFILPFQTQPTTTSSGSVQDPFMKVDLGIGFTHPLWNFTFHALKQYTNGNKDHSPEQINWWLHERDSKTRVRLSSDLLKDHVSVREWKLLKQKNQFDLMLFHAMKEVAHADLLFYQFTGLWAQ